MTTTLRYARWDGITLGDALRRAFPAGRAPTVLAQSVDEYVVGTADGGVVRGARGEDVQPAMVFEARCFAGDAELRWLRDPEAADPTGTAVLVTERADVASDGAARWEATALEVIDAHRYLLWGTVHAVGAATCTLFHGRTGEVAIPAGAVVGGPTVGGRVALRAREYVFVDPGHGNAYVGEERLLELVAVPNDETVEATNA